MKSIVGTLLVLLLVGGVIAGAIVWSGTINAAADEPHSRVVHRLLEIARERSVATRSGAIEVPDLANAELLRNGAGNYAAMCEGCHLRPGLADSELRRGLYPQPPALASRGERDPAQDFWIIKHGLKATAMPAWGLSMDDDAIWGMVAFLRSLPGQREAEYLASVAGSRGHFHGGVDQGASQGDHKHGEHEE
ncbi:MAG: cytochrome c [Gammaproteobacteria bacterium]